MKTITVLILVALGGLGAPQACEPANISVKEVAAYRFAGRQWKAITVPAKLSRECLIALAESMHANEPATAFEFFDAESKDLHLYLNCESSGDEKAIACKLYSQKWIDKHLIAAVQPWDHCGTWTLLTGKRESIKRLEAERCAR